MIAAQRGFLNSVLLFLENGAEIRHRNNMNLNALDLAITHNNYDVAHHFYSKNMLPLKDLNEYLDLSKELKVALFNLPLFYEVLSNKINPKSIPKFNLSGSQKKSLEGKIPDPDETWPDFFKRILKFRLYQPPMVNKNSVPLEKRKTTYVRTQTKLLEIEFDRTS